MFVLFLNSKKNTDNNPILQEILVQISFLAYRHYCRVTLLASVTYTHGMMMMKKKKKENAEKKRKRKDEQE